MNYAIIAKLTGRNENEIKQVSEWDSVIFVQFTSGRPTFVSYKKYYEAASKIEIRLTCGRRQPKAWLAKITGKCPTYRFKRTFVEPTNIEWGRKGMNAAEFTITEPGIYHDSDNDYSIVSFQNGVLEQRYCSKDEVQYHIDQAEKMHGRQRVA